MPFIPTANTAMCELLFTQDTQQMENTIYVSRLDSYDTAELIVVADALIAWWVAHVKALVHNSVTFRGVRATSLESASAPGVERAPGTAQSGALTGNAAPNSVSLAIKFLTLNRGRWARGRNFVVGLTEDQVLHNQIDAAVTAAYIAAYNQLLGNTFLPTGYDWVVVSRQFNKVARTNGYTSPVTSVAVSDNVVDSQRRRLPGRGR